MAVIYVMAKRRDGQLTWSLVVPTYRREYILPRCLKLAAGQIRPPKEIIVVDASTDWEQTRSHVMETIAADHPKIKWIYERAKEASASQQRNQGIELATADVLFLLDDDSLMYLNCASRIIDVYERDTAGVILGVMPLLASKAPDEENNSCNTVPTEIKSRATLRGQVLTRFDRLNNWFKGPVIPPELARLPDVELPKLDVNCAKVPSLHGCRMTIRRAALELEKFDPAMLFAVEETELCVRLLRHGTLVCIHEPLIYHAEAHGGLFKRKGQRYRSMWLIGHAYMCRKLMENEEAMRRYVNHYNRRTRISDFLFGFIKRDFDAWRGSRVATSSVQRILNAPQEQLVETYVSERERLLNQ